MQVDGHLVLHNDAMWPSWGTGVFGSNFINPYVEVQDGDNLVIYHSGWVPIWVSNTQRP